MPTSKLTSEIIAAAVAGFEAQKQKIDLQIAELRAMLGGGSAKTKATREAPPRKRRKFSAAAIKRMREAQQRRWARVKGASQPAPAVTPEPAKPKRRLSAAGRKAIADATRKRWALKRAQEAANTKPAATMKKSASAKAAVKKVAPKKAPAKAPAESVPAPE